VLKVYAPATGKAKPVEEEVITEENVFERPDETMAFFPGQVLKDGYVSTFILIACVILS
jgi:menaquinol-cytochrome c reductase cytochrome b/c subunit